MEAAFAVIFLLAVRVKDMCLYPRSSRAGEKRPFPGTFSC
jgi:hypothetical protein